MVPLTFAADGTTEWHFAQVPGCTPETCLCSDARTGQTSRVAFQTQCAPPGARQADTAGPGELLLDWTKTSTPPPRRLDFARYGRRTLEEVFLDVARGRQNLEAAQ